MCAQLSSSDILHPHPAYAATCRTFSKSTAPAADLAEGGSSSSSSALAALASPHGVPAPLATLRLLLHSVLLETQPRGGQEACCVVVKCGPHWAQTRSRPAEWVAVVSPLPRLLADWAAGGYTLCKVTWVHACQHPRHAYPYIGTAPVTTLTAALLPGACRECREIGWELHLPVYHPSTTLLVAVFSGGKPLGRSQYRIAGLMAAAPGGGSSVKVLKLFSGRSGPDGRRLLAGTVTLMLSCEVSSPGGGCVEQGAAHAQQHHIAFTSLLQLLPSSQEHHQPTSLQP